jgi:WbqC-like protein family
MKLAIMQPYFLPYLGYFQLMAAVDKFVIYDDVRFINRGWINRNRILVKGRDHLFTVPLRGASQNRNINEIAVVAEKSWREKLLRTFELAYSRAPRFVEVFPLVRTIVNFAESNLAGYLRNGLLTIKNYLALPTKIIATSAIYNNRELKGPVRILDICRKEKATTYVNAIGGKDLYEPELFRAHGITLRFLDPTHLEYEQFGAEFQPGLSIVDVLMFNSVDEVRRFLAQAELKP